MQLPRLLLALALAAGTLACRATREMVISSDPPGADIRLDGVLLSQQTPARIPFKDYGVRRVALYRDGYITYSEIFDVSPPWYAYFPIDILSEIVFPVGWRDRHRLRVKLEPGDTKVEAPELLKVVQRAENLRRAGPNGPREEAREARRAPRKMTDEPELVPEPVPAIVPPAPAGAGGGL